MKNFKHLPFWVAFFISTALLSCKHNPDIPEPEAETPEKYTLSILAGGIDKPGFSDGVGQSASFGALGGIETGPDGTIYVVDASNQAVRKITPEGSVSTVPTPIGFQAYGIEVGDNGAIYISEIGPPGEDRGRILQINPDSTLVKYPGNRIARDFGKDSSGNIWVAHGQIISELGPNGTFTDSINCEYYLKGMWNLDFCRNDIMWVSTILGPPEVVRMSEYGRAQKWGRTGNLEENSRPSVPLSDATFNSISGLVITKDGSTVYLVDFPYIKAINKSKVTILEIQSTEGYEFRPVAIALSPSEDVLYVSDQGYAVWKLQLK